MKIHFASGEHPFEDGWVNVDVNAFPGVDITANLLSDFPPEIKDIEISYVGHFLEHLSKDEAVQFLSRVLDKTIVGGSIVIVGPDVEKGLDWKNKGLIDGDFLYRIGAHGFIDESRPFDRESIHVWDCTGHEVVDLCVEAGWSDVSEIPIESMKRAPMIDASGWQFCVIAKKSSNVI